MSNLWTLTNDTTYLEGTNADFAIIYHRPSRSEIQINRHSLNLLKLLMKGYSSTQIIEFFKNRHQKDISKDVSTFLSEMQKKDLLAPGDPKSYPYSLRRIPDSKLHLADVHIEIIKGCNLRCQHCYMSAPEITSTKNFHEMSLDMFDSIILDAAKLGTRIISITGGEPLLHNQLKDMISRIFSLGMETVLFTNATLIDTTWAEWFAMYHLKQARISLDGLTEETHNKFRGAPHAYSRTIKGIQNLQSSGVPVHVTITGHKGNIAEVPELIRYVKEELGAEFSLDTVVPTGLAIQDQTMILHPNQFRNAIEPYIKKPNLEHDEEFPIKNIPLEEREYFCGAGNSYVFIDSDGRVRACPTMYNEKFVGGYLTDKTLGEIWLNSGNFQTIRYMNCRHIETCKFASVCKGGCRSRALSMFGELDSPDYYSCAAHGLDIPPEIDELIQKRINKTPGFVSLDSITENPMSLTT